MPSTTTLKAKLLSLIPGHKHPTNPPQDPASTQNSSPNNPTQDPIFQANRLSTFIEIGELATVLMKDLERIENLETGFNGLVADSENSSGGSGSQGSKAFVKWDDVLRRFVELENALETGREVVEVMRGRAEGVTMIQEVLDVLEVEDGEGGAGIDSPSHEKGELKNDVKNVDEKVGTEDIDDTALPERLLRRRPNMGDLRSMSENDVGQKEEVEILTHVVESE